MSRVQEASRLGPDLSAPWVLPSGPTGVTVARKATVHQLERLGVTATEAVDTVELLVSELTSNVVKHVGGRSTLCLVRNGNIIRIEVRDTEPASAPVERRLDRAAEGGRGLLLVSSLATDWGFEQDGNTKCTWAELDLNAVTKN